MTSGDWDAKYRAASADVPEPDAFLTEAFRCFPARDAPQAADVACGGGRNAIAMARRGCSVRCIDRSLEALRLSARRARRAGVDVETLQLDLEVPGAELGAACFDVVAVFNYLHRPLIPAIRHCVRPGGIVVYKTFTTTQLQFGTGPRNPAFLLRENELRQLFAGFRHLLYREECEVRGTAALVAQRPFASRS